MSSLTSQLSSVSEEQEDPLTNSAVMIQLWYKGIVQQKGFRKRLLQDRDSIETVLATLNECKSCQRSHETRKKLDEPTLRVAVKAILLALPATSKYALGHLSGKLAKVGSHSSKDIIPAFITSLLSHHMR